MSVISPSPLFQSQDAFREALSRLTQAKSLRIDSKGNLIPSKLFQGFFNGKIVDNNRLVELKVMEFLVHGKKWLLPRDLQDIESLAQKAGLFLRNAKSFKDHRELRLLIALLSKEILQKEPVSWSDYTKLCQAYQTRYRTVLAPFSKQCKQISTTFAETYKINEENDRQGSQAGAGEEKALPVDSEINLDQKSEQEKSALLKTVVHYSSPEIKFPSVIASKIQEENEQADAETGFSDQEATSDSSTMSQDQNDDQQSEPLPQIIACYSSPETLFPFAILEETSTETCGLPLSEAPSVEEPEITKEASVVDEPKIVEIEKNLSLKQVKVFFHDHKDLITKVALGSLATLAATVTTYYCYQSLSTLSFWSTANDSSVNHSSINISLPDPKRIVDEVINAGFPLPTCIANASTAIPAKALHFVSVIPSFLNPIPLIPESLPTPTPQIFPAAVIPESSFNHDASETALTYLMGGVVASIVGIAACLCGKKTESSDEQPFDFERFQGNSSSSATEDLGAYLAADEGVPETPPSPKTPVRGVPVAETQSKQKQDAFHSPKTPVGAFYTATPTNVFTPLFGPKTPFAAQSPFTSIWKVRTPKSLAKGNLEVAFESTYDPIMYAKELIMQIGLLMKEGGLVDSKMLQTMKCVAKAILYTFTKKTPLEHQTEVSELELALREALEVLKMATPSKTAVLVDREKPPVPPNFDIPASANTDRLPPPPPPPLPFMAIASGSNVPPPPPPPPPPFMAIASGSNVPPPPPPFLQGLATKQALQVKKDPKTEWYMNRAKDCLTLKNLKLSEFASTLEKFTLEELEALVAINKDDKKPDNVSDQVWDCYTATVRGQKIAESWRGFFELKGGYIDQVTKRISTIKTKNISDPEFVEKQGKESRQFVLPTQAASADYIAELSRKLVTKAQQAGSFESPTKKRALAHDLNSPPIIRKLKPTQHTLTEAQLITAVEECFNEFKEVLRSNFEAAKRRFGNSSDIIAMLQELQKANQAFNKTELTQLLEKEDQLRALESEYKLALEYTRSHNRDGEFYKRHLVELEEKARSKLVQQLVKKRVTEQRAEELVAAIPSLAKYDDSEES